MDETELFVGPYLLKEKNAVLQRYLQIEKEKAQRILTLLQEKGEGMARQQQLQMEIDRIIRAEERMK